MLHYPLVEDCHPVAHGKGLVLVMGDVDRGDAEFALEVLELLPELVAQLGVQIGERLVEQQNLGLQHERPGDGDALLLPAGQLGHVFAQLVFGQVDPPGDIADEAVALGRLLLADAEAEGDVLPHAHAGEKRIVLEHHADLALVAREPGDSLPVDVDLAGGRLDEPRQGAQGGCLSAARGSKQREEFPRFHLEIKVGNGGEVAEGDFDVLETDHGEPVFCWRRSAGCSTGRGRGRHQLAGCGPPEVSSCIPVRSFQPTCPCFPARSSSRCPAA